MTTLARIVGTRLPHGPWVTFLVCEACFQGNADLLDGERTNSRVDAHMLTLLSRRSCRLCGGEVSAAA